MQRYRVRFELDMRNVFAFESYFQIVFQICIVYFTGRINEKYYKAKSQASICLFVIDQR